MDHLLFAPAPRGTESLLASELRTLGARAIRELWAGVSFSASLETAYRVCLWSRIASRVLLQVASGPAGTADELYSTVRTVPWDEHLDVTGTFAVSFTGISDSIRDTRYGAVRVKDAIADQFRERYAGRRPSVDPQTPDIRINAHLSGDRITVSIDLSGDGLHRRGYRLDKIQVKAPLKENLAAAVLLYAGWSGDAGSSFVDPLCGSGTLPIEAAMIAGDVAPGLMRAELPGGFGFIRWKGHQASVWQCLVDDARRRRDAGISRLKSSGAATAIVGSDADRGALRVAAGCVERAGLRNVIRLRHVSLEELCAPAEDGLIAANVPYGKRLGERQEAEAVCRLLGRRLRSCFAGWRAVVLAGDRRQIDALGLSVTRETTLHNGALRCPLACLSLEGDEGAATPLSPLRSAASVRDSESRLPGTGDCTSRAGPKRPMTGDQAESQLGGGPEMLANRLRKNRRRLSRRLRREDITCFRLYDADLPDYNLVVDVYGDWVHVQEYAAPPEIDPAKAKRRLEEALAVIASVLELPHDRMVVKQRRPQRGAAQYTPLAETGELHPVDEDGLTYLVNLTDRLDTGLFIDQRLTRRLVRALAGGRRFLNLFAYTGTMTVSALAGGAPSSVSVDLSATYLNWAQRNLAANGFAATYDQGPSGRSPVAHKLVRADCLTWIAENKGEFDLIWLDPPTFSNSKRMGRATFDVQRDHGDLIRLTARRFLAPGGTLLFATNRRAFRLNGDSLAGLEVEDLSRRTLPFDCERAASRHHVYRFKHSG